MIFESSSTSLILSIFCYKMMTSGYFTTERAEPTPAACTEG